MKITKRNRIHIVAVLVLLATFSAAGCGTDTTEEGELNAVEEEAPDDKALVIVNDINEGNQDKDITGGKDETDSQEASTEKKNIYDYVLTQYIDMVRNDFYEDLLGSETYDSSFGEDIGLEIRMRKQDIYYTFYDIDGNGTMELIIAGEERGVSNPAFSPWNYDLYGYDGTNVVHIFPEMEFGYRTNFSLYENGVIEVFYSNSAAESGVDFYRIGNDGFTPELVDSFTAVGRLKGEEAVFSYFQNGHEITESEYKVNIQSYEVPFATALDWMQIQ